MTEESTAGAGTVCAVVRSSATLEALRRQTRPPDDVLVHNGPVAERLQAAVERGAAWLWLLEEDVVPAPGALEQLLMPAAGQGELPAPVLMASKVLGPDGRLHRRSAPWPRSRGEDVIAACRHRLVPLRLAGWGSLLVRRDAVTRHGLPREDFRSGADDLEWTGRLLAEGHGYLSPRSLATRSGLFDGPSHREVRDRVRMMRSSDSWARQERLWFAFRVADDAVRDLRSGRRARTLVRLTRGTAAGLTRRS